MAFYVDLSDECKDFSKVWIYIVAVVVIMFGSVCGLILWLISRYSPLLLRLLAQHKG